LLIGKLVETKKLSLDMTLLDIFSQTNDWINVKQATEKQSIRLEEILMNTAGLKTPFINYGFSHLQRDVPEVLDFLEYDEGMRGTFNRIETYQISAYIILRASGGLTPEEYAKSCGVFEALGITERDYTWNKVSEDNPKSVQATANGLITNALTQAKLGQLYLQDGRPADGHLPIIDPDWIDKSAITNQLPKGVTSSNVLFAGYGYYWFNDISQDDILNMLILPNLAGGYDSSGYGGNLIAVFPKANAVVAIVGNAQDSGDSQRFLLSLFRNLHKIDEIKGGECEEPLPLDSIMDLASTTFLMTANRYMANFKITQTITDLILNTFGGLFP